MNLSNDSLQTLEDENLTQEVVASQLPLNDHQSDIFSFNMVLSEFHNINLPCIIVSNTIIIITLLVTEFLYKVVLNNVLPGLVRQCVLDLISAGEATIISWELLTMFHQYGEPLWALGAWVTITIKLYKYKPDVTPCPYSHILSLIDRNISLKHAAARIISQFTGGIICYR